MWRSEAVAWFAAIAIMVALSVGLIALRSRPLVATAAAPAVAATATPSPPAFRADTTNMLANPSFEVSGASPGVADGWDRTDQRVQYSLDTRARYGDRSQLIRKTGSSDPVKEYGGIQQTVAVSGGASYIVSADYMYAFDSAPDVTRSVGIVIYCLDGDRHFVDSGTAIDWGWPASTEWTRRSLTFRTPTQTAFVVVQFRISVNGSFWIDGAELLRVEG